MKKTALLFYLFTYTALYLLLFNGYKYVIDPDSTGYMKIAERVAAGDYTRSVNGLWSPLNAWLLVPFLKAGISATLAARYLNGIFGFISMISLFYLLRKFIIHSWLMHCLMCSFVLIILHYTFHDLFADMLLVMMLLLYLNLICAKNFINSYKHLVGCGLFCALGFYAKAYFFYFAILHVSVVIYLLLKPEQFSWKQWLIKTSLVLGTMLILVIPWGMALSAKYGKLTISTAGQYNQTWVLSNVYPQPNTLIMPPHYPDGLSFWDDPTYWPVTNITPFTNKTVFIHQLRLLFTNSLETSRLLHDFSFLSTAVLLAVLSAVVYKNSAFFNNRNNLLLLSMLCIFPAGYILLHVEHRFIWILSIILLIFAGILLTILYNSGLLKKQLLKIFSIFIAASFCIYPLRMLQADYHSGLDAYQLAAVLQQHHIGGRIISNFRNNQEQAKSLAVCYLLKGQCYGPASKSHSSAEILQAIKDYQVDYYLLYYDNPWEQEMFLQSPLARNATHVLPDIYPGVLVLSYK
jgi:hypothetical protein